MSSSTVILATKEGLDASKAQWLDLVKAQQDGLMTTHGLAANASREHRGALEGSFYVASVGFVGEAVSGFVIVVLDKAAAVACQQHLGIPAEQHHHDDFAGEFGNMFAGKIKSALLARGLRVNIATPAVLQVDNLLLAPPVSDYSTCELVEGPAGKVAFQTELHSAEVLDFTIKEEADAPVEGMSLFL